jgi:hypothetical protein
MPEQAGWSKDALVDRTATIVLAEVISIETQGRQSTFVFRTLESLKGKQQTTFSLLLSAAPANYKEVHFANHRAQEFWRSTHGRLPWLPGSCTPHYAFKQGARYLLFIESLGNGASAERIHHNSDRWYKYVASRAKTAF